MKKISLISVWHLIIISLLFFFVSCSNRPKAAGIWELTSENAYLPKHIKIEKVRKDAWGCETYREGGVAIGRSILSNEQAKVSLALELWTGSRALPMDFSYIVDNDGFLYVQNNEKQINGKYKSIRKLPF